MVTSAFFAFLHFVAVFGVVAAVFLEWQTMSPAPTRAEALRIQRCDRWYGLFAMLLETMARDSEKHATMLRYLLRRLEEHGA